MKKLFPVLLVALLLCMSAAWAETNLPHAPQFYLGTWEGGTSYGDASEYYLYVTDYRDGCFTLDLAIYRIWSFDGCTAALLDNMPSALLQTAPEDGYAVTGILAFSGDGLVLDILSSDHPDLPAGASIRFH